MKLNDNQHFLLSDVFLEDLKQIVAIYRATNSNVTQDTFLNEDFGIPVCVAKRAQQIIGCFFLNLDAADQSKISSYISIDKEFEDKGIEQLFQQRIAEKINIKLAERRIKPEVDQEQCLGYAFGFDDVDVFKAAVFRFVDWLNTCE